MPKDSPPIPSKLIDDARLLLSPRAGTNPAAEEWLNALERHESADSRLDVPKEAINLFVSQCAQLLNDFKELSKSAATLGGELTRHDFRELLAQDEELEKSYQKHRSSFEIWINQLNGSALQADAARLFPNDVSSLLRLRQAQISLCACLGGAIPSGSELNEPNPALSRSQPADDDFVSTIRELNRELVSSKKNLCDLEERKEKFVQRIKFSPILFTKSYQEWEKQMDQRCEDLEKRLSCWTENYKKAPSSDETKSRILLGRLLDKVNHNEFDFEKETGGLTEQIKCLEQLHALAEGPRSIVDAMKDTLRRLSLAQTMVPSLPDDWTKPAGELALLLLLTAVGYVSLGSILLKQPLWTLSSAGDALAFVFSPAYLVAVAALFLAAGSAFKRLKKNIAADVDRRLGELLNGNTSLVENTDKFLEKFFKQLRYAFVFAILSCLTGIAVMWEMNLSASGPNVRSGDACVEHFVRFGDGVVTWNEPFNGWHPVRGALLPAKEPMTVICWPPPKSEESKSQPPPVVLYYREAETPEKSTSLNAGKLDLILEQFARYGPLSSVMVRDIKELGGSLRTIQNDLSAMRKTDFAKDETVRDVLNKMEAIKSELSTLGDKEDKIVEGVLNLRRDMIWANVKDGFKKVFDRNRNPGSQ